MDKNGGWLELNSLGLPNYDNPLYTDPRMVKNPIYFPHAFWNFEKVINKIPAVEGEPIVKYYAGLNLDDLMPKYKDNPNTSFFKIVFQSFFYAIAG